MYIHLDVILLVVLEFIIKENTNKTASYNSIFVMK